MTAIDRSRRMAVAALAGSVVLAAVPASAQPRPFRKKIVICLPAASGRDPDGPIKKSWSEDLARHGFIEGENLELSIVRAKSIDFIANAKEWEEVARQVVASRPDVIVIFSIWLHIFKPLTRDIPIVFMGMLDPEYHGSIDSLRRPGGNVTGVAEPFFEVQEKRFELLRELRPRARRVAVVWGGGGPYARRVEEKLKSAAGRLGMEPVALGLPNDTPTEALMSALRSARVDVADFLWSYSHMKPDLFDGLVKLGVASSFGGPFSVRAGGLLSYYSTGTGSIVFGLVLRILQGEKVATMPAEQPFEFSLVVNLRTARALGITVPQSVLVRANEVIE